MGANRVALFINVVLCLASVVWCLHFSNIKHPTFKYLNSAKPIFVAGGSSGLGLEVVKKLSSMGIPTNVLVRRAASKLALSSFPGVKVHLGDATDAQAVQDCMAECVAAVTTLGGELNYGGPIRERIDYVGNSNVVEQAGILGCERIVLVTSIGCGNSEKAIKDRSVFLKMEQILQAKTLAERDLKTYTNLDWTIVRPGRLVDGPPAGRAVLSADPLSTGQVTREACAQAIVEVLASSRCTRRELSVYDPTLPPHCSSESFEL